MNNDLKEVEGRDFLKLITERDPDEIDENYSGWEIEEWLREMGYEWNGFSWVPMED